MISPPNLLRQRQSGAPWGIGIVGGGDISHRYEKCVRESARFTLLGTARRDVSVQDLLVDDRVDIILNLTPPLHHSDISRQALSAGKHVYSEKPLAHSLEAAKLLQDQANTLGLTLACAPATYLGPALQEARRQIDADALGKIIGARGIVIYPGPNYWHHNPAPLFGEAAGPLFDMGVYHLSALVALLGPINQVCSMASQAHATRHVAKGPKAEQIFDVTVPTHVNALIKFESGAIGDLAFSFDGLCSEAPPLEIYGTKGTLSLPQPGQFDGPVKLATSFGQFHDIDLAHWDWSQELWIGGLHAMADHLEGLDTPWPKSSLALHVLEAMTCIAASAAQGRFESLIMTCERPIPLPEQAYMRWAQTHESAR